MNYWHKIASVRATVQMWVCIFCMIPTISCVKFEPEGFLFISTDTVDVDLGDKGIYEFKGSIVNIGKEKITQHGFCWAETRQPILSDDTTSLGETDTKGEYSSIIGGLKAQTTYHMRAYVVSGTETVYGNEKIFVASTLVVPTVQTEEVIHFKRHSAVCGGEVLLEGAAPVFDRGICWSTRQKPTMADQKKSAGSGTGSFKIDITGLELNTIYYVRAYGINSEGTAYGKEVSFKTWDVDEFSDYEGNLYATKKIGEQTWMRQNLKVTHYADGTPIPEVKTGWNLLTPGSEAYCWYNNDFINGYAYGALYTWSAVMRGAQSSDKNPSEVQGVCPDGWHVPSDQEWQEMEIYLGMDPEEADTIVFRDRGEGIGGRLKETGTVRWRNPNTGATNMSGFTAVPGGYRTQYGDFRNLGRRAFYWTSTVYQPGNILIRGLDYLNTFVDRDYINDYNAASLRCVKDD